MSRLRALAIAGAVLAATAASGQERFLLDNLAYTAGSSTGPVTFSETQFPANTVINGKSVTSLNATPLPAQLKFTFTVYGMPSSDATVSDFSYLNSFISPLENNVVEGTTAGILSIDFGTTATDVTFDFLLQSDKMQPINPGCKVTAFDAGGTPVGSSTYDTTVPYFYPQGQASFSLSSGFRRLDIKFASSFPEEIPALGAAGLAALTLLLAAAGALALRRD